jgi:predicted AAA+ superfamily ATPase
MEKQILREVIADQKRQELPSDLVEREIYHNIESYLTDLQIIVISGIRRCGKSTLLQQIRQRCAQQDFYLNFDDERLLHFKVTDFQMLLEVFVEMYGEQKLLFFDEIQNIKGWERFVRRLHDNGYKVIVTGSNALMLSRELGTHLTGRYHQVELFPFSFREYLLFEKFPLPDYSSTVGRSILQQKFNNYTEDGGIPGYLATKQKDYLKVLYEGILYRDIVARYNLNKIAELKELVYYCASNIGKEISFNVYTQKFHLCRCKFLG